MGSNGSRDIAKAKQDGDVASSSRTLRSAFSNSFSSHGNLGFFFPLVRLFFPVALAFFQFLA